VNILVDTSVWSLALRRRASDLNREETAIVGELTHVIREGRARIIGLIRQELLSGIKNSSQYEKLRNILRAFSDESLETANYEAAAEAGNKCRAKGIATTAPDMLICAVAQARDWSVFSTDPDFQEYARVLPIKPHAPRR
jgi:predicted nucleic acid-binding protein